MSWEEIDYFFNNYFSYYIDDVAKEEEKNKVFILDIGCGSGRLLDHIGKNYDLEDVKYVGIDSSDAMLEEAKKDFPRKDFFLLDMVDLDKLEKTIKQAIVKEEFDKANVKIKGKSLKYNNIKVKSLDFLNGGYGLKFDYIFFIASFHHLQFNEGRIKVLQESYKLLKKGGMVFMINWALNSEINYNKYTDSLVKGSENDFGGTDYNIYIGEYPRYYHCFSLKELEYLFNTTGFEIIENRLSDTKKNYISIIKKV